MLCEKSQLRLFRTGCRSIDRSLSRPRFDRLEVTPQFSAVLPDLVASFATIERCEQRICKLAPCDPQQFLQAVYGAEQIVWRCHPPGRFRKKRRQRFVKISLIRTLRETPRWGFAPPSLFRVLLKAKQQAGAPIDFKNLEFPESYFSSRVNRLLIKGSRRRLKQCSKVASRWSRLADSSESWFRTTLLMNNRR